MSRHERAPSQWAGRWDALAIIEDEIILPHSSTQENTYKTEIRSPLKH